MSKKKVLQLIWLSVLLYAYAYSYFSNSQEYKTADNIINFQTPPVLSVATSLPESTQSGQYKVVKVVDGDTIELADGTKVRYIGIDTPETVDPKRPDGCFGIEASNKNKELVLGKTVSLEKDISETDKFGRLLRYVYVDNVMVNDELVKNGYAKVSTYPPDVKYQEMFLESQDYAKNNNLGLWTKCF